MISKLYQSCSWIHVGNYKTFFYVLQWHVRTFIDENMSQQKIAKYLRNLLGDPNFQINHVIEDCFIYKHRNVYTLIMVEM